MKKTTDLNNKISELQKQVDTLQHSLLNVKNELELEKAKANKQRIFQECDEDTTIAEIAEKVRDFSTQHAEFELRSFGSHRDQSFFLGDGSECPWEIIKDDQFAWVLKLKEIQ